MSLHVYFCHLPYSVTVGQSSDPPDPGETYTPCGMVVAETRGKAKAIFMRHDPGVDELLDVRTNCVARYVDDILVTPRAGVLTAPRDIDPPKPGETWNPKIPHFQRLYYDCWARVHEIEDHGGRKCDCPELEWDDATQDWKAASFT